MAESQDTVLTIDQLAEYLKLSKSTLYRTIVAVAQRIPENVLQEDPKLLMWYDQALTRMGEE